MVGVLVADGLVLVEVAVEAGRIAPVVPSITHQMGRMSTPSEDLAQALANHIAALGATADLDGSTIARVWWSGPEELAEQIAKLVKDAVAAAGTG